LPLLALIGAASVPALAAGDSFHPLEDIRAQVTAYLEGELTSPGVDHRLSVSELDPRLRLPFCETGLEMALTGNRARSGNVTVHVRCTGPRPWSLYVPARARALAPVVVLARPVSPGTPLQAGDLQVVEREVSELTGGHFSDPGTLLGKVLRRALAPGVPVVPSAVESPMLIQRGERVPIVARVAGVDVRMEGEALRGGAAGETIPVRNLGSRRVVEGRVTAERTVEVAM
jgi:flagella basal body P-ring formation protein FlgA